MQKSTPDEQTILLVEDEIPSAEMLSAFLEMNGFKVITAHDGGEAVRLMELHAQEISLAVLDIMVPVIDGRELCRRIREHSGLSSIPVIFLTAKDEEQDEIAGLTIGADDYISKPASLNLILAHIRSLLRRHRGSSGGVAEEAVFKVGGIELNPAEMLVLAGGQSVDLTPREFRLLELLMRNPKRVFTRQEILEHISEESAYVFDRTVDVHVKNIRLKLGDFGALVRTYRGQGYGIDRDRIR